MKKYLLITGAILSTLSFPALSEQRVNFQNQVPGFDSFIESYRRDINRMQRMFSGEEAGGSMRDIIKEYNTLTQEMEIQRIAQYNSAIALATNSDSCTNGVSGKVKDCNLRTVKCPQNMYNGSEAQIFGGGVKHRGQTRDSFSFNIRKTGKGRNEGGVTLICRYEPQYITASVSAEMSRILEIVDGDSN